ncbi:MAG: HAD-IA family hydrolase [Patescibacteria group bacterium]
MIKAVIFDVDGVLLDSFEANFLFFESLFQKTGFTPPTREEFREIFHKPMWDVIKIVTGLKDENDIRKIWDKGLNEEFDTPDAELSVGVSEVVTLLSKEYLLGLATSRVKVHEFEGPLRVLKQYFKATTTYEDTENHKPHPEPLLRAAELLGVDPVDCVYIGDAESDAMAARATGMKIIVYSKERMEGVDGQTADFSKIPAIIKNL